MKPASLTRSTDFRRVRDEGRAARRNGLRVTVLPRGDGDPPRVGYAVGARAGGAVVRNRVKRRLRAAVREVGVEPGRDVVISAGPEVLLMEFQILVDKLRAALVAAEATR